MATYYSPLSFFKGGKRTTRKAKKTRKTKGGFYPSIMGGVVQTGAYLVPLAVRQGYKLLKNKRYTLRKKNRK